MKALVTGGAGFIGSNLVAALIQKGIDVLAIDNFSSGHFENLAGIKADVVPEDASDINWERFLPADVIFHEQAITDTTVSDQAWMLKQNTEAFRRLLKFAVQRRIPLIYASSAGVYGNEPPPQRESGPHHPLNIYGFSKLQMDRLAESAFREAKSPIVGLRYFNVFGSNEKHKKTSASMIYQLAEQMKNGKRPRIFEFGEQKRDHIYVKDVVSANLAAWESVKSGIYNVGTGISTSFNRLIEIIQSTLGTNCETDYFKNPYALYQNHTQADVSLVAREIGFKAEWTIETGIRDYLTQIYGLSTSSKRLFGEINPKSLRATERSEAI